jgi:hypothetical protein
MEHHSDPAQAPEFEIVGKPTMLAKYQGRLEAEQILDSLGRIGFPLDDVSVLFMVEGSDQVIDLRTGHTAAGQAINDEDLKPQQWTKGQTAVLLHPDPGKAEAVRQALAAVGTPEIEYAGETHAFGRPGGVDRIDEPAVPSAGPQERIVEPTIAGEDVQEPADAPTVPAESAKGPGETY